MRLSILFVILSLFLISCESGKKQESSPLGNHLSSPNEKLEDGLPCDDPEEKPKVEITEEGINLLDTDEGCKLEK